MSWASAGAYWKRLRLLAARGCWIWDAARDCWLCRWFIFFFFNDTATTEIYTSLHTLSTRRSSDLGSAGLPGGPAIGVQHLRFGLERRRSEEHTSELQSRNDISYAVFCLKKKKK